MKVFNIFLAFLSILPWLFLQKKTKQPNVFLVIADDMGLDPSAWGKIGSQLAFMPNLESLCATGVTFNHLYVAPTCSST
jgi:arylsulfatase A-like enzyme